MKTMPTNLKPYKKTPLFNSTNVPQGLLKNHNTREGVWAKIIVTRSQLVYTIENHEQHLLSPGVEGIVEPQVLHHVTLEADTEFYVEFYS